MPAAPMLLALAQLAHAANHAQWAMPGRPHRLSHSRPLVQLLLSVFVFSTTSS